MPCPVCKEVLKSEFQEDEEEWIWRNAVRVGDKVSPPMLTRSTRSNPSSSGISCHLSRRRVRPKPPCRTVEGRCCQSKSLADARCSTSQVFIDTQFIVT